MRLQGILHTKFYPATFAYESKGRRFESCRGHQKLKLTSCEVSFFIYLFIFLRPQRDRKAESTACP